MIMSKYRCSSSWSTDLKRSLNCSYEEYSYMYFLEEDTLYRYVKWHFSRNIFYGEFIYIIGDEI